MLIDQLQPDYDATRVEHRVIEGNPTAVYQAVMRADFIRAWRGSPAVRLLFGLRSLIERTIATIRGQRRPEPPEPEQMRLVDMPRRGEWVLLGEVPPDEVAFGVIGRFWTGDTSWEQIDAGDFPGFHKPGFAKIACNFSLRPYGERRILVTYEARTKATDPASRRELLRYWRPLSPFIGVVMRAMSATIERDLPIEPDGGGRGGDSSAAGGARAVIVGALTEGAPTTQTTIVVADDHSVVRSGLRLLLDAEPDLEVVGEAGDLPDAVRKVGAHRPAILVLDLNMPGGSTLQEIPTLRERSPGTAIVVLTMQDDPAFAREAMRAGALGYVLKQAAEDELVEAVRRAATGDTYLNPNLGARVAAEPLARVGPPDDLTEREAEILRMIALGHTNTEIAGALYLSVRTVESHRSHIQQKLRLSTRAELVRYALDRDLLER